MRELTKRYKEIVERYGLEGWVPKDFDFREFMKGLESIQTIPLRQGCLKGDGRSNYEIKACASKKNIADCSACDQPAACNKCARAMDREFAMSV